MLATSPAVQISGTGSCRAVPAAPETGQDPAPRCKVEIRSLGPMEMQGTNQPQVCRRRWRQPHEAEELGSQANSAENLRGVLSILINTAAAIKWMQLLQNGAKL